MAATRGMRRAMTVAVAATVLATACSSSGGSPVSTPGAEPTTTDTGQPGSSPVPELSMPGPVATVPATAAPGRPDDTVAHGALVDPVVELLDVGSFDQPVQVAVRPGDSQFYVVEQPGRVVAATDEGSDVVLDVTDIVLSGGEQGLLGLAFHPNTRLAYVYFTDRDGDTVVAEFTVDDAGEFDRRSMRVVMTVDQPYANHNGGQLAFGPDQMLYIGLGDGGSGGDPERHALDMASRLGKILRIDPTGDADGDFTIPSDNPFVGRADADPTIWAYGLRNPWRFSFDPATGDLWIADVGQGDWEEINHAPATDRADAGRGVNFGWSAFEGFERFNDDQPIDDAVAPIYVYDHSASRCSVSGGVVVRESSVPDLDGWYVFGDYCTGEIWALDPSAPPDAPRVVALAELSALAAISTGPDGDVYAVSNNGTVARFVAG